MEGNETACLSDEEEDLDPRIQSELERLNKASEEINRLELSLEDARSRFRKLLNESTTELDSLSKKLGNCVDKARPYYQARLNARELQAETQKSALRYERACSMHAAAKEMVNVAEQGFLNKGQQFDTAWQEMLNHATSKVNEAETEIMESELDHAKMTMIFHESEQTVKKLHHQHKRAVNKSRPYFERKGELNRRMEEQKTKVGRLSKELREQKYAYSYALKQLETISDEIHAERDRRRARRALGTRGTGVGAEDPGPSHSEDRARSLHSEDRGRSLHSGESAEKTLPATIVSKPETDETDLEKTLLAPDPAGASRESSPSRKSPRKSPSSSKKSLILSAGALNQEFRHLSLPRSNLGPSVQVEDPLENPSSPERFRAPKKNGEDDAETRDDVSVRTTESADTADSEDILDTDSDAGSSTAPDDDMIRDALHDFADEMEPAERFRTLPANVKFSDLKHYFKQGELKKWSGEESLH